MTIRLPLITILAIVSALPVMAQADVTATTEPSALAASASLTLTLESPGNIERNIVSYLCDDAQTISVQYVNAAPNFLAIVPVEGQNLVFATTISGSGARYVSGPYEWWSHQGEATLRDLMQDADAEPIATCTEASNTP